MTETPWLDPDELAAWRHLSAVLLLLPGHLDDALADHGLSFFEYSMLVALSAAEGRQRPMSDLAAATQGSLSRLSHAAKRLERRGWTTRTRSPDDGRVTLVQLTNEGLATLERAAPDHVRSVRRVVLDVLDTDQLAHLRDIGRAITTAIRPDHAPMWERARPAGGEE